MKAALRAAAIVFISVSAGIGMANLVDRSLKIRSKPVLLFMPFAAAVATGVALLRIGKRPERGPTSAATLIPYPPASRPGSARGATAQRIFC